jgi:TnpA family transposase
LPHPVETYSAALAELVNAQFRQPFAVSWGDSTTSSSDGQNFKAGGRGQFGGQVNLKYGQEPGVQFYTHISDQYAPFPTKVINATVGDATHVLDGLLYHESDLRIEAHYTDTAGFTDHVFALMHLLGSALHRVFATLPTSACRAFGTPPFGNDCAQSDA